MPGTTSSIKVFRSARLEGESSAGNRWAVCAAKGAANRNEKNPQMIVVERMGFILSPPIWMIWLAAIIAIDLRRSNAVIFSGNYKKNDLSEVTSRFDG